MSRAVLLSKLWIWFIKRKWGRPTRLQSVPSSCTYSKSKVAKETEGRRGGGEICRSWVVYSTQLSEYRRTPGKSCVAKWCLGSCVSTCLGPQPRYWKTQRVNENNAISVLHPPPEMVNPPHPIYVYTSICICHIERVIWPTCPACWRFFVQSRGCLINKCNITLVANNKIVIDCNKLV